MELKFDEVSQKWIYNMELLENCNEYYAEAYIKYFNILYQLYEKAFDVCEFSSLLTIFNVKGLEDAGWDPYESSKQIIRSIVETNDKIDDSITQKNLHLWIYGHIIEASGPYEKIMNFLNVISGEPYLAEQFPPNERGIPQFPKAKIKKIKNKLQELGFIKVGTIYEEIWDGELRNSIFHSDYSIYGGEIRTRSPLKVYTSEEISKKVNNALAYFEVIDSLQNFFISRYQESRVINVHRSCTPVPDEQAVVIVRDGHGAVGIKDNYSLEELASGAIPFRIGRFYPEELELLNNNPVLSQLPRR